MVVDEKSIFREFNSLKELFPDSTLVLQKADDNNWEVSGLLHLHAAHPDSPVIHDAFEIQVKIPRDYPKEIPLVKETGNRIPTNFHKFTNGALCLGAPLAVKKSFLEDPTLIGFFKNCLAPYLYGFSYKEINGNLPFGELSHGGLGLLEYYRDLFGTKNTKVTIQLLLILAKSKYRGHMPCPCKSGKRLRNCHGHILLEVMQYQAQSEFRNDLERIAGGSENLGSSPPT